jgi:hypothetical protein
MARCHHGNRNSSKVGLCSVSFSKNAFSENEAGVPEREPEDLRHNKTGSELAHRKRTASLTYQVGLRLRGPSCKVDATPIKRPKAIFARNAHRITRKSWFAFLRTAFLFRRSNSHDAATKRMGPARELLMVSMSHNRSSAVNHWSGGRARCLSGYEDFRSRVGTGRSNITMTETPRSARLSGDTTC